MHTEFLRRARRFFVIVSPSAAAAVAAAALVVVEAVATTALAATASGDRAPSTLPLLLLRLSTLPLDVEGGAISERDELLVGDGARLPLLEKSADDCATSASKSSLALSTDANRLTIIEKGRTKRTLRYRLIGPLGNVAAVRLSMRVVGCSRRRLLFRSIAIVIVVAVVVGILVAVIFVFKLLVGLGGCGRRDRLVVRFDGRCIFVARVSNFA